MTSSAAIELSLGPGLILGLLAAKGPLFRMSRMIRSGPPVPQRHGAYGVPPGGGAGAKP